MRGPPGEIGFSINTLRPRQNGRHFPDDIFKRIFLNENARISIWFSLKFVPKCPINNIPTLFQIMAWRRPGDKPLSEPMVVSLLTYICVTRPQWVKTSDWVAVVTCQSKAMYKLCFLIYDWGRSGYKSHASKSMLVHKIFKYGFWLTSGCAANQTGAMPENRVNTLRPRQIGRHLPDDIFKCIFLSENVNIYFTISMTFVHKGPINNIPALVQIMAWRRPGDKPNSEPMRVNLLTHICVTRPQWVIN